jgi:hypothetical protein
MTGTKKHRCDKCGKTVENEAELFKMDFDCIANLIEELNLLRTANYLLRRELEDKYGIVKTVYH